MLGCESEGKVPEGASGEDWRAWCLSQDSNVFDTAKCQERTNVEKTGPLATDLECHLKHLIAVNEVKPFE